MKVDKTHNLCKCGRVKHYTSRRCRKCYAVQDTSGYWRAKKRKSNWRKNDGKG